MSTDNYVLIRRLHDGYYWENPPQGGTMIARWPSKGVPEPPWHILHRDRWDALERAGWRFSFPSDAEGGIGLRMERLTVRVTIICDRHDTLSQIHTRLLTLCEGIHAAHESL
jgi:hypothetical protein